MNASKIPYDPYVTHISIDKCIISAGLNKIPTLRGNHKDSQGQNFVQKLVVLIVAPIVFVFQLTRFGVRISKQLAISLGHLLMGSLI